MINNANEAVKLTMDLETGMRGFTSSGDEHSSIARNAAAHMRGSTLAD